ncbi:hypothetical protein MFIFM68171_07055 [Madurella fahalii]|uniref:Zn(2)-C6 fungal-type domain-containing protein n=1 Tax=Madurella fahalii TaxID=1157608 RepID=A0ABQ0GGZ4_9PEZI
MARLRLGYTKSRTGCLRCKQRRVKCDENRPCKACVRHGIECSLVSGEPNANQPAASSPLTATSPAPTRARRMPNRPRRPINPKLNPCPPSSEHPGEQASDTVPSPDGSALTLAESPLTTASPDPFPYFAKFVTGQPEEDTANWVSDLELLHHFTTSTFKTFSTRDETERLWQVEVPKQAFAHVFLLHHILALSAYHLAHLHPQRRQAHSLRASQHQSLGIRGMRMALTRITADNCHALFASASFLFICALASSTAEPTIDDLVDVFLLVKGIGSVLSSSDATIRSGPLSELFVRRGPAERLNPTLNRVVLALEDFSDQLDKTQSDERVWDIIHTEAKRLATAIREASAASKDSEYRVVAAWPILMMDDLVPLLRQRNHAALALVSYYCVVFHEAELQYWFMKGWTSGVIRDILKTIESPWNQHSAWAQGWINSRVNMG